MRGLVVKVVYVVVAGVLGIGRRGLSNGISGRCVAAIGETDPCIFTSSLQDGSEPGRGRPKDPWSQEAGGERGSPRPLSQVKARTVAGAAERARIMQGRVRPEKAGGRMEGEVMVGIDVSKARLDVAVLPGEEIFREEHDSRGIAALIERLKKIAPALVVLEASGGLETGLVAELVAAGLPAAVVNPRQVRDFARATMFLTENLFARQHCDIESGLTHVYSDHHFTFHPYTCLFRPSPSLHDAGSLGGPGDCSGFDLAQWARRPTLPAGLLRPRVL